jgi:hypothetical protein
MKSDIENNEWKADAPYLASLPKTNPFQVPEQYFDGLAKSILSSVYVDRLKQDIPTSGFIVPDNYFSELHDQLILIASDELLDGLPKIAGFNTPDHYFQQLQSKILARTVAEETVKTNILPTKSGSKIVRLWHSDLIKYASAACFILVTAFGLYLNQQSPVKKQTVTDMANEQLLYDLDEQEIIDHIDGVTEESPTVKVTHEELENYILNNYSQNDLTAENN